MSPCARGALPRPTRTTVGVGIGVTVDPLHGSRRADFPHRALASVAELDANVGAWYARENTFATYGAFSKRNGAIWRPPDRGRGEGDRQRSRAASARASEPATILSIERLQVRGCVPGGGERVLPAGARHATPHPDAPGHGHGTRWRGSLPIGHLQSEGISLRPTGRATVDRHRRVSRRTDLAPTAPRSRLAG